MWESAHMLIRAESVITAMIIERFIAKNRVGTFNRIDKDGTITKGGYSTSIVVHERYCYKIPNNYPLEKVAPLLCAGITVYTPMMKHKMNQAGKSLGVIGLGGLGHMAVKFGKTFSLNVTIISTSETKKEEAINRLGADRFILSKDNDQMAVSIYLRRNLWPLLLILLQVVVRLIRTFLYLKLMELWFLLVFLAKSK